MFNLFSKLHLRIFLYFDFKTLKKILVEQIHDQNENLFKIWEIAIEKAIVSPKIIHEITTKVTLTKG